MTTDNVLTAAQQAADGLAAVLAMIERGDLTASPVETARAEGALIAYRAVIAGAGPPVV